MHTDVGLSTIFIWTFSLWLSKTQLPSTKCSIIYQQQPYLDLKLLFGTYYSTSQAFIHVHIVYFTFTDQLFMCAKCSVYGNYFLNTEYNISDQKYRVEL